MQIPQNLSLPHAVYCLERLLRWVGLCLLPDGTLCECRIQPDGIAWGTPAKETLGTTTNTWFIFLYFASEAKGTVNTHPWVLQSGLLSFPSVLTLLVQLMWSFTRSQVSSGPWCNWGHSLSSHLFLFLHSVCPPGPSTSPHSLRRVSPQALSRLGSLLWQWSALSYDVFYRGLTF